MVRADSQGEVSGVKRTKQGLFTLFQTSCRHYLKQLQAGRFFYGVAITKGHKHNKDTDYLT